jgi:hypothetical protein
MKNDREERSGQFTKIYYVPRKNFDVCELNAIIFFNHEIRFSELSELSNFFSFQRFFKHSAFIVIGKFFISKVTTRNNLFSGRYYETSVFFNQYRAAQYDDTGTGKSY